MVKMSLSKAVVEVQSLVGELRSHVSQPKKPKHETSKIVINSIKTLKMVHIKKNLKKQDWYSECICKNK